jgi:hypothetical protein
MRHFDARRPARIDRLPSKAGRYHAVRRKIVGMTGTFAGRR